MIRKPFRLFATATTLLFLLIAGRTEAQTIIGGQWGSEPDNLITLWMLRGDMRLPVDSARTGNDGTFSIATKWNVPAGMYVLDDENGESLRLFLGSGAVTLKKNDKVQFIASPDNIVWQDWTIARESFVRKQDVLEALIDAYPTDEKFRKKAINELNKQRQNFQKTATKLSKTPGASIASAFISADMPPMLAPGITGIEKVEALREYLLNMLSINDTLLIQSDILPGRVLDYLTLFQHKGMSRQQMEESFQGAIDKLMHNASAQNKMYFFYLEYLFEGFQRLGFNQITDFLSGLPHFDSSKASIEDLFEVERIIGPYHNIINGRIAPPIETMDINGQAFDLYSVEAPNTLVLFWSETCPHCLHMLPDIKAILNEKTDLKVVSIILGPDKPSLRELIVNQGIEEWIHICEPEEWRSPLVDAYRVYGTPSMYLLDSAKRIVARPNNAADLRESLNMP